MLPKFLQKGKCEMPNRPMPHQAVRELVWNTTFGVICTTAEDFLPEMPFKEAVEMIAIVNAIFKADLARRPTNQVRLAKKMGMSRTAVRRRLEVLEARDVIEDGWRKEHGASPIRINTEMLASPKSDARLRKLVQLILDAAAALSKLKV